MKLHAAQRPVLEFATSDEALPEFGSGGEAAGLVVRARIEEITGRRLVIQPKSLIGLGGKSRNVVVLEDEVAEAVEDGLPFIDLDPERQMRTMAGDDIGPCVDGRMRKI